MDNVGEVMNYEELLEVVNGYLSKLEAEFQQENYEVDFMIKKLDSYVYAFHQDMKFKLSEELDNPKKVEDIESIEEKIKKPHIEPVNNTKEEYIKGIFKQILRDVEAFEKHCRGKYSYNSEISISTIFGEARPERVDILHLERLLKGNIEAAFTINIKSSKTEMYVKQIVDSFAEGNFNNSRGWEKFRSSKMNNIIEDVTNHVKKKENSKATSEVFAKYREYLRSCIEGYKMVSKLEATTPIKETVHKKVGKPVIDYIEICYVGGEKRKVSFESLFTPFDVNVLEEKIDDIIKLVE